jgi:methyl-accepting chemotaxis protein
MTTAPPAAGDATGSWSSLRWRLAGLAGVVLLGAGAVQGVVLLQLHPEFTTRQLAGLAALSLAAAVAGGALVAWLAGTLLLPLRQVRKAAEAMAAGTVPPPLHLEAAEGDVAALANGLDDLGTTLRSLLGGLATAASRLGEESGALRRGVARHGAAAAGQSEAMRRATANAAAISEVTRDAAREADSVIVMTQRAESLSGEGLAAAEQAVRSAGALGEQVRRIAATMGDLSERTLQVGEIATSVKDLAEQSNLLALNASIEAAKAGEHGRGFAAVAMEMRNLAEQSRQAAGQVRSILGEIQKYAREAALATEEGSARAALATGRTRSAGEAIEGLALVIRESAESARAIADRTRQQTAGAADLVAAIAELAETSRVGAEDSAALESIAGEIATVSARLTALSGRFRS